MVSGARHAQRPDDGVQPGQGRIGHDLGDQVGRDAQAGEGIRPDAGAIELLQAQQVVLRGTCCRGHAPQCAAPDRSDAALRWATCVDSVVGPRTPGIRLPRRSRRPCVIDRSVPGWRDSAGDACRARRRRHWARAHSDTEVLDAQVAAIAGRPGCVDPGAPTRADDRPGQPAGTTSAGASPAPAPTPSAPLVSRRVAAEIGMYTGAALVLVSIGGVVARGWAAWEPGVRWAFAGLTTVALIAAGLFVRLPWSRTVSDERRRAVSALLTTGRRGGHDRASAWRSGPHRAPCPSGPGNAARALGVVVAMLVVNLIARTPVSESGLLGCAGVGGLGRRAPGARAPGPSWWGWASSGPGSASRWARGRRDRDGAGRGPGAGRLRRDGGGPLGVADPGRAGGGRRPGARGLPARAGQLLARAGRRVRRPPWLRRWPATSWARRWRCSSAGWPRWSSRGSRCAAPAADSVAGCHEGPRSASDRGPSGEGQSCWPQSGRDLVCLRALLALGDLELDALLLLERPVAAGLDGAVVNEDVCGAVVGGDEAVPLLGVEPLDGALCHGASYSSCRCEMSCCSTLFVQQRHHRTTHQGRARTRAYTVVSGPCARGPISWRGPGCRSASRRRGSPRRSRAG